MLLAPLRWLANNVGTLLLAFVLSMVVWVSATVTADPNEQNVFRPVAIEVVGKDPNLVLVNEIASQVRVTLEAPRTVWNSLNNNPGKVKAWVDLSGLEPGIHTVPVRVQIADISPVRDIRRDPQDIQVELEPLVTRTLPVQLVIDGSPPLGYKRGDVASSHTEVTVSGPGSQMEKVVQARATLDISGARETKTIEVPVEAVDENELPVPDITINPNTITVTQAVSLEGGYKNVVVKVVTTGSIAPGYRLTNISVSPPIVTVVSANPQLVNLLPGYVETMPVDLTSLSDDIEIRVELNLPEGVSLVGEQSVLVQVGVAAIEGSLTISLPVETLGLSPDLAANLSPPIIDVIVSGPLPVLDTLTTASFRVVVDLTGLATGVYQISPVVDLVPAEVQIQSVIPDTIEVVIGPPPTPGSPLPGTPINNSGIPALSGQP